MLQFTFDPCKMHLMQLLDLCCTSGSLTISLPTFGIIYIGYHFSSGRSTRSVYWSTSVSIKQLHHVWLRCAFPSQQPTTDVTSALQHTATWQFHESDWQDTEEEVSLCLVHSCGTHYHWLSVMYHWHWLSSVHDWRLFCFPEPTGHRHSASVTVSGVKFVCANTNLLTYLLAAVWCAYSVKNAMQLCGLRDWSN